MIRSLRPGGLVVASSVRQGRLHAAQFAVPGICVAEANLPDGSGIALLQDLRSQGWAQGIILARHGDAASISRALGAGVKSVVASEDTPGVSASAEASQVMQNLSPRELEVLEHVADGFCNRKIATRLGVSPLTVKTHLRRIALKVGTGERAGMVMLALRAGVIS